VAATQYVLTTDTRLSDARSPISGSANYIQNGAGLQAGSQFNISGNGTVGGTMSANVVNATTQFNIGGSVVLDAVLATQNTLVGLQTGTGGTNLTAVGFQAGKASTGNNNTFVGSAAGLSNLGGGQNTFMGQGTGPQNTTGANNSFYGTQAGFNNVGGGSNAFFGVTAGNLNTSGGSNAFFGLQAGFSNSTGSSNTAVGKGAGFFSTIGSNNTFIGFSAGPPNGTGDLNQSAAIGANAVVTTDNTIVLGTSTETTSIPGKLAVSTLGAAGATALCRNASQQLATCSSSLRYKTNLTPYGRGMDIIDRLNPIAFSWKADGMRDLGFGAEDVAKIEPLLVTYNAQGQIEGLKYDRITVALVNAVKEQQKQIETLKKLVCADHPGAEVCK
jgi:trimeric autotransporter adhesin